MRRAVFLDRDGVLTAPVLRRGRLRAPLSLDTFHPYPWAGAAVRDLRNAGLLCFVVTNQPELATGELDPETLLAMHDVLRQDVAVDGVYVCPHVDDDLCHCRKPHPGLLRQAARDWDLDLERSFIVGDRWRDIAAGRAAGCRTLLVAGPEHGPARPHHRVDTLVDAATTILTLTGERP
jgi:D-glycero-D-manno-heptose 1,7-bisphosphate phosphatase